ncbi:hypothetical protein MHM88_14515 [Epibacterium sp. MM17-32]|uniref:hypothetical protein n=1 Tax=Epibacterium sp. MM17-32 TaxID=2917734 RepID=UPI001EF6B8C6|nr:hypothetical protein [Epibacterium sp. MM17-32]MCG7629021.1 hypothetical protein [Epibacterium sp. MM17-32]
MVLLADAGAILRDLEAGFPRSELHADPAWVVDEIAETLEDLGHTSKSDFLGEGDV